jgi:hypothetical protein
MAGTRSLLPALIRAMRSAKRPSLAHRLVPRPVPRQGDVVATRPNDDLDNGPVVFALRLLFHNLSFCESIQMRR